MADDSSSSIESFGSGSDSEAILECETDEEVDSESDGVRPYMFEPEDSSASERSASSSGSEVEDPRTRRNDWCLCGSCQ